MKCRTEKPAKPITTRLTLMTREIRSGASLIASAPPEEQARFLEALDREALLALPYLFDFWALPHQLPPKGDWRSWVIMGGRGAGKTRAGAEWVRAQVEGSGPTDPGPANRVALIGETIDQAREVMVFGESGILACSPPDRRPDWEASRKRLVWPNGAIAQVFSASEPEALRGPQFDAAWLDEIGCPAVDKGSNAPNRFSDPKSSESALPPYSTGRRDDLIQMQFLIAHAGYWADPANNPVSDIYDGAMIDTNRCFVWAWDARPFPHFPNTAAIWSDGANYETGHWINGRASSRALSSIVEEICAEAGLVHVDTSELFGVVRGYAPGGAHSGRALLDPLLAAFGVDAIERDGKLIFKSRSDRVVQTLDAGDLAVSVDVSGAVERSRAADAGTVGRVRINALEASGDYQVRAAEAIFPDDATQTVAQSELPLLLTGAESRAIAERWLAEARVARETVRFVLPPSHLQIGAGDVVSLKVDDSESTFKIAELDQAGARIVEAVQVDDGLNMPANSTVEDPIAPRLFSAPVPVEVAFLDLPLIKGTELPHAPHVAVTAKPWSGSAAIYKSASSDGFVLNTLIDRAATIGVTETEMLRARSGTFDRGPALRVRMAGGSLQSVSVAEMLNGANAMAIGTPGLDIWEVFQFATATLVGQDIYELSGRLRGQLGTDNLIPEIWPPGSQVILLNTALRQIALDPSERQLARVFRTGPAQRPVTDPIYIEETRAFDGVGMRPYAPVHLRFRKDGSGGGVLSWIRRTRIDGDTWAGLDVPLGEELESYLIRVTEAGQIRREETVGTPAWVYGGAEKAADGITGSYEIEVAQLSERFGPGLFGRITIND